MHGVFPGEEFEQRVLGIARDMAANLSPVAVRAAKRQVYAEQLHLQPGRSVEDAKALTAQLLEHPDCRAGVAAMQQKRAPTFAPLSPRGT